MREKFMQDLLMQFPAEILDEPGLVYLEREVKTGGRRLDLILKDRMGRHVLLEVQAGALDTQHTDRHIDFVEGYLQKNPEVDVRVVFVANWIDVLRKSFLQRRGYEFKEISESRLKEIASKHGVQEDGPALSDGGGSKMLPADRKSRAGGNIQANPDADGLIEILKGSDKYKSLKGVLGKKIANEAEAKRILEENLGMIGKNHLQRIFTLVNEPYRKDDPWPWFGKLIGPNQKGMLELATQREINNWFGILTDNQVGIDERIDRLLRGPERIRGANVGLITLMMYLLDKPRFLIWFEPQHEGLRILHPEIGKFNRKGSQYKIFNSLAKQFGNKYSFSDTELDWVFQEIQKMSRNPKK